MKRPKSSSLPYSYTSLSQQHRSSELPEDDDDVENLPLHQMGSFNSNNSSNNSNTATFKSLNLDNLTSKSARDNTLFTITQVGTHHSRNGLYIRPSWRKSFYDHFRNPEKLKAWAIMALFLASLRPLHQLFLVRGNDSEYTDSPIEENVDDLISFNNQNFQSLSTSEAMKNIDNLCRSNHGKEKGSGSGANKKKRGSSSSSTADCKCINPMEPETGSSSGWLPAHRANLELARLDENKLLDVVFLGDSIVEEWNGRWDGEQQTSHTFEEIHQVWTDLFTRSAKNHSDMAINGLALGIAGDRIANLLWRINNGELEGVNSKAFWVLIGTNDLTDECTEDVVLLGIIRVAEEIRRLKPDSIVVLNGILPRSNRADGRLTFPSRASIDGHDGENSKDTISDVNVDGTDDYYRRTRKEKSEEYEVPKKENSPNHNHTYWQSIEGINHGLSMYAGQNEKVEYFDASDVFVTQLGNKVFQREEKFLVKELQRDYLHPSPLGHKLWGEAILDYIVSDLDTPQNLRKDAGR